MCFINYVFVACVKARLVAKKQSIYQILTGLTIMLF